MDDFFKALALHEDVIRSSLTGVTAAIVGGSFYWIVVKAKGTNAIRAWLRDLDSSARSVAAKDLRTGLQLLLQDGEARADDGLARVFAALDQHRLTSNTHEWRLGCARWALYTCIMMGVMVIGAWITHWVTMTSTKWETAFLVGWLIAVTTYSLRAFLPIFRLAWNYGEPTKGPPTHAAAVEGSVVEQGEAAMNGRK